MAPLLYVHLKAAGVQLPRDVRRTLQGLVLRHREINRVRMRVLRDILSTYDSAGIPALVLKGAALAHLVYPEPGLRPMSDLDILVPESELWRAQRLLARESEQLARQVCGAVRIAADLLDVVSNAGANMEFDFLRFLINRYEPNDGPQQQVVAFLRQLFGDEVMIAPMLKSTAISDAGLTQQTIFEVERAQFHRNTYDRALDSLNLVNDEIELLLHKAWGR